MPKDPIILLSYVNTRLRDCGMNLEGLCDDMNVDRREVEEILAKLDYHYHAETNQFV